MATKLNTADGLLQHFSDCVEKNKATISTWKAKLDDFPNHALVWSGDVYAAAASLEVCSYLVVSINHMINQRASDEQVVEALRKYLTSELVRRSSYITNESTSPTSNLFDRHVLAVMARILDKLGDWDY